MLEKVEIIIDRCARWWVIEVPYEGQVFHSQAKHFKNIELMALDLLSLMTGRPESDFSVTLKARNEQIAMLIEKSRALISDEC